MYMLNISNAYVKLKCYSSVTYVQLQFNVRNEYVYVEFNLS